MQLFQDIVKLCEVMFSIILYFFKICYAVGKCLFWIFAKIFSQQTWSYLSGFYDGTMLLFQEMFAFWNEIDQLIGKILGIFHENITEAFRNFINLPKSIRQIICEQPTLKLTKMTFSERFNEWTNLSKDLAIEIGQGAWFAVTFLPNCLLWAIKSVLNICSMTMLELREAITTIGYFMLRQGQAFNEYFLDVPIQATCGLVFILICLSNWQRTLCGMALVLRFILTISRKVIRFLYRSVRWPIHRIYILVSQVNLLRGRAYNRINNADRRSQSEEINEPLASTSQQQQNQNTKPMCSHHKQKCSPNTNFCVICQDSEKNIVLFPCKHLCMCSMCASEWCAIQSICPICRVQINRRVTVYV